MPQHLLEELDVLDPGGQLARKITGEVETLAVGQLIGNRALHDKRSERPAPTSQRRDEDSLGSLLKDEWLLEPQSARGGMARVAGGDAMSGSLLWPASDEAKR